MLCDHSRARQEEERWFFFPGKDSANEKPWTLCVLSLPTSFSAIRVLSIFAGESWLQTPNCNSLLIPNKPIFAGEVSGNLFDLGQQKHQSATSPEKPLQPKTMKSSWKPVRQVENTRVLYLHRHLHTAECAGHLMWPWGREGSSPEWWRLYFLISPAISELKFEFSWFLELQI